MPGHVILLGLLACLSAASARAGVAVLVNHTTEVVTFRVAPMIDGAPTRLAPGEAIPLFSADPIRVTYPTTAGPRSISLAADTAYRFASVPGARGKTLELRRIALGRAGVPPRVDAWRSTAGRGDSSVRVLLCVDEEEPMRQELWKQRLRKRLLEASRILEQHSGVRFEPIGEATWQSGNAETRFERSLAEFERSVTPPQPGVLVIGFSSQYRVRQGRQHLGGTRGALRNHILLKEWSPRIGEAERVELLVHELGHFLGAAHSPEPTSVMRPVIGDRPVRLREERIRFDAVNTLAIAMVGEEVRRRGARQLTDLTAGRRHRLLQLYGTLAAITPGEPAAAALLRRLNGVRGGDPAPRPEVVTDADRLEAAAAAVVDAAISVASINHKLPASERLTGEALTNALARGGAAATSDPKALLIGLGIALDDFGGLRINPRTREVARRIEPDARRNRRLNVLGRPAARQRHDTLKHFIVSAALVAMVGEEEAYLWGVGKELSDATRPGGSGFSFPDLAANRAGIRFARGVLAGSFPPEGLARSFRINNYVPPLDGLAEGLPLTELIKQYGGQGDPRFNAEVENIDQRVESLPAYALQNLDLPGF